MRPVCNGFTETFHSRMIGCHGDVDCTGLDPEGFNAPTAFMNASEPGASGTLSTAQVRSPSSPCRAVETAAGPESSATGSVGRQKCSAASFTISNLLWT